MSNLRRRGNVGLLALGLLLRGRHGCRIARGQVAVCCWEFSIMVDEN